MSDQEASDVNEDVDVLEDDGYTVMGGVKEKTGRRRHKYKIFIYLFINNNIIKQEQSTSFTI